MIIESFFLFLLCRTREEVLSIDIAKYHCNRPEIAISFPNEEKTTVIGLNTFLPFSVSHTFLFVSTAKAIYVKLALKVVCINLIRSNHSLLIKNTF